VAKDNSLFFVSVGYFVTRKADLEAARTGARIRYPSERRRERIWAPTKPVAPVRRTRGLVVMVAMRR
jgi:hypothetical protein